MGFMNPLMDSHMNSLMDSHRVINTIRLEDPEIDENKHPMYVLALGVGLRHVKRLDIPKRGILPVQPLVLLVRPRCKDSVSSCGCQNSPFALYTVWSVSREQFVSRSPRETLFLFIFPPLTLLLDDDLEA